MEDQKNESTIENHWIFDKNSIIWPSDICSILLTLIPWKSIHFEPFFFKKRTFIFRSFHWISNILGYFLQKFFSQKERKYLANLSRLWKWSEFRVCKNLFTFPKSGFQCISFICVKWHTRNSCQLFRSGAFIEQSIFI